LNINEYQLGRAKLHCERDNLQEYCGYLKGDFMNIPAPDNSFDAIYEVEATCHAPDKEGIYAEIFRKLKPGCEF
jgi:sterol 24-C-methyltransferase